MPHQLRRIIAIRNPSDGNPLGRISELDPRGGVLAVGGTTHQRIHADLGGVEPSACGHLFGRGAFTTLV